MPTKKRKIGFYYLTSKDNDEEINIPDSLNQLLIDLNELNKTDKNRIIKGHKFGLLDNINSNRGRTRHKLLFKSATHSFRPPLIDKETADERDSPKTMSEGETQKTHIITKTINGDVILILEKHQQGMTIKQVVEYLNYYSTLSNEENPVKYDHEIIVKDSFLEEIDSLQRIVTADVFVDKQLLSGDAMNYSERINSVQHEVIVSVKAKKMDTIYDFTRDAFAKMNGGENRVNRIRVVGRNDENNEVKINTDFIERQEYVFPSVNNVTGEIISRDLFNEMSNVLNNFN